MLAMVIVQLLEVIEVKLKSFLQLSACNLNLLVMKDMACIRPKSKSNRNLN